MEIKRVIGGSPSGLIQELVSVWHHRRLVLTLTRREMKIKYAQTVLGLFWAVLRPLAYMLIYSFFFSHVIKLKTTGPPYPLIALVGILSWNFFTDIVQTAGNSLLNDAPLVKRNAFPRMILPIYRSMISSVDYAISLIIFFALQVFFDFPFNMKIFLLPLFFFANLITGLGVALWASAMSVRIRDFSHFISIGLQIGFWATPVFYTPDLLPEKFRLMQVVNPMAGLITGYRWLLLDLAPPGAGYILSMLVALTIFFSGLWVFHRVQAQAADYL